MRLRITAAFRCSVIFSLLALLACVSVSPALGTTIVTVTIDDDKGAPVVVIVPLIQPDPQDPDIYVGGGFSSVPGRWNMDTPFFVAVEDRHAKLNINPSFAIRNISGSTSEITVDFVLTPHNQITGSVLGGGAALVGATQGGASTVAGGNFYSALTDGVIRHTLLPDPISIPGAPGTQQVSDDFGRPGDVAPSFPSLVDIGIRWQLNLDDAKIASFNPDFTVREEFVPEPSSFVLAGLGMFWLFGVFVRRSHRQRS